MHRHWQWDSIAWPRRLLLRPESRGLCLVTHPSKQIQRSNFLGLSLLCIQAKFWWNSRNCSHAKSSSSNYIFLIEDFAHGLQTRNFSIWKLQATGGIIHTYSFFVTGLWWMFLQNIRFCTEFIFQVWLFCPMSELLMNNIKLKLVSGRDKVFSLVFLLCYLCEQASTWVGIHNSQRC